MDINQCNLEVLLGLTEVVMIRLPLKESVNKDELAALTQIATSNPLPDNWSSLQSEVARTSPGFHEWLRRLSRGKWQPSEADGWVKAKIANIDFELPWCARLRWGARNLENVDVFIHATGGVNSIKWESIHERTTDS
jgi:hypothetical protein